MPRFLIVTRKRKPVPGRTHARVVVAPRDCDRGSITLCHTLIEAALVDEYRLFVYPLVQGRGRRLFPDGFELPRLELLESKAFESGITYSRYAAA
jgi:hypothetical protein